jgi:tetratricopeptide (TPR) repeat protein
MEAGVKFEHAASFADSMESMEAYEQAAKSFKVAGDLQRSMQNYSRAIALCKRNSRYVKAAGLSESLADICANPEDQLYALQDAIELYEQVEDLRGSQVRERVAQYLAQLRRYSEAGVMYFQRALGLSADPVLIHAARKNWLLGLSCKMLADTKSLNDREIYPAWFVGSEEHKVFDRWVQYREGLVDEFKTNLDLPRWLLDIPLSDSLC